MFISALTLDDLLNNVFTELLNRPFNVVSSRSIGLGASSEIIGITLNLKNAKARLSREETKGTVFSALGELLWYLSKENSLEFIKYYIKKYENESDDKKTVYGGYGPRIFKSKDIINQVDNVINLLRKKETSRRAVIQIFDSKDLVGKHIEIPCTCTLQFFIRNSKLIMYTNMRSNDAFMGLPHDIFAFTLLQEIIATSLNLQTGEYFHAVGSLHLYKKNEVGAKNYLNAGYQSTKLYMPDMPLGDNWSDIEKLLEIENSIRLHGYDRSLQLPFTNSYWNDFVYLLQAYSILKSPFLTEIDRKNLLYIKDMFSTKVYNVYIEKKMFDKTVS